MNSRISHPCRVLAPGDMITLDLLALPGEDGRRLTIPKKQNKRPLRIISLDELEQEHITAIPGSRPLA